MSDSVKPSDGSEPSSAAHCSAEYVVEVRVDGGDWMRCDPPRATEEYARNHAARILAGRETLNYECRIVEIVTTERILPNDKLMHGPKKPNL